MSLSRQLFELLVSCSLPLLHHLELPEQLAHPAGPLHLHIGAGHVVGPGAHLLLLVKTKARRTGELKDVALVTPVELLTVGGEISIVPVLDTRAPGAGTLLVR